jgi:hypothetical protein
MSSPHAILVFLLDIFSSLSRPVTFPVLDFDSDIFHIFEKYSLVFIVGKCSKR